MKNWVKLVVSIAMPQVIGITASLFTTTGEGSWYRTIEKPEWNPPGWVFAPVWTTLYLMMGIAFYLIWTSDAISRRKRPAMGFWFAQLIFNFFWSIIFFDAQEIGYAMVEIFLLWLLILTTTILFFKINKLAGWLMIPYLAWVAFAAILNFTIWDLNR